MFYDRYGDTIEAQIMTTETLLDLIDYRCREALSLAELAAAGTDRLPSYVEATHGLTDVLGLIAEYRAEYDRDMSRWIAAIEAGETVDPFAA